MYFLQIDKTSTKSVNFFILIRAIWTNVDQLFMVK